MVDDILTVKTHAYTMSGGLCLYNVNHYAHFFGKSTVLQRFSDLKESVSISYHEVLPTQEERSLQSPQRDHRG